MLDTITSAIPVSLTTQALLLGTVIGAVTYLTLKKKYRLPPGPWRPPLLGILLDMRGEESLFEKFIKWSKFYGPVFFVKLGPIPCVVINNSELANEALVKKGTEFGGRIHTYSTGLLTRGNKDILMSDISTEWKLMRKIALQGLRQYLSGSQLEDKLFESAMKVMTLMREQNGQVVDMRKYISLLIFNLLQGVCFNKSFDLDDKLFVEMFDIFESTNSDFGSGFLEDIIPPLRYFPTKRFTRVMDKFETYIQIIEREFDTHQQNFREDDMNDFTDFLIHAKKEAAVENPEVDSLVTDVHLSQTVSDIFSAGVDTSRLTICWTLLLLAANPEIQEKLQAEVDSVLEVNETPRVRDRTRLPYTEAVLHESIRLKPVGPIAVHAARCDTTIGDYDVPKGTMVMFNIYALHVDPKNWVDPLVFRPERMLDADGQIAPKTWSWLPFSAGRRNCLGETIARPELHLLLALLVRNFNFKCPEGKTIDLSHEGSLILLPKDVELLIEARN